MAVADEVQQDGLLECAYAECDVRFKPRHKGQRYHSRACAYAARRGSKLVPPGTQVVAPGAVVVPEGAHVVPDARPLPMPHRAHDGRFIVPLDAAWRDFPTLRQSLLGDFHACALMTRFKLDHERGWHSNPQARGSHFHRFAALLLRKLAAEDQNQLTDEPECPRCGYRPNDHLVEGELPYREGNPCPMCDMPLELRALTDLALGYLADAIAQREVAPEEWLPLPSPEDALDLEWVAIKFAQEQRFAIGNLDSVEERLEYVISYPNPLGGTVQRTLSGQPDALFVFQDEDGLHAVIPDWKDTWDMPGPEAISPEGYWQQRFYALLVMKNNPAVVRCTLDETYVRFKGGDTGLENHRRATIQRRQLDRIEQQVSVVAELFDRAWAYFDAWLNGGEELREALRPALEAAWTPTPGGHCGWCPLTGHCPILPQARREGAITTAEEAEEVSGQWVVAKRFVKFAESALKNYLRVPRNGERPAVPVTKATGVPSNRKGGDVDGLPVYQDRRPGMPQGIPIKYTKGSKVLTIVEKKDGGGEYLRLAEEQVPVDAETGGAPVPAPVVRDAISEAEERLALVRKLAL